MVRKSNSPCTCVQEGDSSSPCTVIEETTALVGCTISNDGWYSKRANKAHNLFKYIVCVFYRNVNPSSEASWRYFRMKTYLAAICIILTLQE